MELAHPSDTPILSEDEQLAFFDSALSAAREAERRSRLEVVHLVLGGSRIELRFAGPALARLYLPALAHLRVPDDAAPDVSIHLFDSASTGVGMIPPPCSRECFTDRGDIWGLNSPRIRSAFHWIEFSLNLLDLERKIGVYWVDSTKELPYWSKASPLRTLLHWWMEQQGAQLLHAAALATNGGALLITGRGGVGKSTTALTSIVHGLRYLADDYLVVTLEPEPTVHSLYCTAKLNPDQVGRFPELAPYVSYAGLGDDEKAVLRLVPGLEDRFAVSAPIRAIATPVFSGTSETSFGPVLTDVLRRAAAFTTMSQLPHAGPRTHDFIDRLVRQLPGLTIRLGTDLPGVASGIRTLLEEDDATLQQRAHQGVAPASTAQPLVTVVVPVFNGAQFLPAAIRNLTDQGWGSLEIIVVDDGSRDNVEEVIRTLPVDVRFFRQENAGPAAARNRGIRDASGEFIAFLDVDDLWPEGNLTHMIRRLQEEPEAIAVHGRAQVFRGDGEDRVFLGNPAQSFPHYIGAGVYRRDAFQQVGLFDAELRFGEDSDWFARAHEHQARILHVDEITLLVRRHDGNMTRGKSLVELNTLRLFKKALDRRRNGGAA